MTHTLAHAVNGCDCERKDIWSCVICGRELDFVRNHNEVCGPKCFKKLLDEQRQARRTP